MTAILEPDDLPDPYHHKRQDCHIHLPADLIAQVDQLIQEYKKVHPEICVWRSRFVETALRYFVRNFQTLTLTEEV
jgi:metal-responsive CopG/Arc/MetJ family transcriptional regulator